MHTGCCSQRQLCQSLASQHWLARGRCSPSPLPHLERAVQIVSSTKNFPAPRLTPGCFCPAQQVSSSYPTSTPQTPPDRETMPIGGSFPTNAKPLHASQRICWVMLSLGLCVVQGIMACNSRCQGLHRGQAGGGATEVLFQYGHSTGGKLLQSSSPLASPHGCTHSLRAYESSSRDTDVLMTSATHSPSPPMASPHARPHPYRPRSSGAVDYLRHPQLQSVLASQPYSGRHGGKQHPMRGCVACILHGYVCGPMRRGWQVATAVWF